MTNGIKSLGVLLLLCIAVNAQDEAQRLLQLYKELHAAPELSQQEEKTAARMAQEFRALGYSITEKIGGHGVLALLENGPGPVLWIRADMDALPVTEETGVAWASKVRAASSAGPESGVMHACGHDMHMTVAVGTAAKLVASKAHWSGTLMFLLQPAEEIGVGAKAMLADGLLKRAPKPDTILAQHVDAAVATGQVSVTPGPIFACVDSVDVVVRGVGGHGAYPHRARDPVVLAAQMVLAFQTLVSRENSPLDPAVVTVGSIHGGTKHNVIGEEVKMQLTVRCYDERVRKQLLGGIKRIAEHTARAAGMPEDRLPTVHVHESESLGALVNTPEYAAHATKVLAAALPGGAASVLCRAPEMGAEDFALFGQAVASARLLMFRLGTIPPARVAAAEQGGPPLPSIHSPRYAPDPAPSIATGVTAMYALALDALGKR
ncbi:MAG: amidohydrolase [Planctomycetes bacterium]|nr:amidohydrolase [Planctomycetota bacterium]